MPHCHRRVEIKLSQQPDGRTDTKYEKDNLEVCSSGSGPVSQRFAIDRTMDINRTCSSMANRVELAISQLQPFLKRGPGLWPQGGKVKVGHLFYVLGCCGGGGAVALPFSYASVGLVNSSMIYECCIP